MKKTIIYFLITIQNITLFISSILAIIFYNCFNIEFYKKFYQQENLASFIGTNYDELLKNTTNLLDYLNGKNSLNKNWFTDKDILHMIDVKDLYDTSFKFMIFGFIIFSITTTLIIFLSRSKTLNYITALFNKILLCFILLIGLLAGIISTNFNSFWIKFHTTLFSNDLWLLSPDESNLIKMVPEEFFISLIEKIIIQVLLLFILLFILNLVVKKKVNKH
ncbi:TIGR01906 family membrane protein [Gemella cuniculi]|uniref:TIGR01906 family membrane protein n=1 Tax=Gemella cuniculi TaxID=150240 RepID=UPI0003FF622C|nr:TIGR01906 family membrane protein [Gemella cuniculi]